MKTKHAKGPDGQPLISINTGRGRGRPKKNTGRVTLVDSTSEDYFRTTERGGGPLDPVVGFKEIYAEIYIRPAPKPLMEEEEGMEEDLDESSQKDLKEDASEDVPAAEEEKKPEPKKRGRKPKHVIE